MSSPTGPWWQHHGPSYFHYAMKTPYSFYSALYCIIGVAFLSLTTTARATLTATANRLAPPLHGTLQLKQMWGRGVRLIPGDSSLLDSLLHTNPFLTRIATNPQYELQIIYTQIDRDAHFYSPHLPPQSPPVLQPRQLGQTSRSSPLARKAE